MIVTAKRNILAASGMIFTGPGKLISFYCGGMDLVNDPTFAIYDSPSEAVGTSGTLVYASVKLDASVLSPYGSNQFAACPFRDGAYYYKVAEDLTVLFLYIQP